MAITALPTPPSRATPSTFSTLADAFLGALPTFATEANAQAAALELNDTTDASTTSNAVGLGAKTFTVTAGKSFQPGMWLVIADTAAPSTNQMFGSVTSYSGTTLVMNITLVAGSGTKTAWTISFSAPRGATGADGANAWTRTTGTFTATPASTSTLTMTTDMTASIKAGMSLKYVSAEHGAYYGRVSAIAANLLTVNGPAMDHDITELYYGGGTLRQVVVILPGLYEATHSHTKIAAILLSQLVWELPTSYCVYFKVYSVVHDSGTTPGTVSVEINAADVCTTAGGLSVAANATWYSTVVDIAPAAYDVNPGEVIEISAVVGITGTVGNASDLTVEMIFLTP
mgnify:CR=1 FL=1